MPFSIIGSTEDVNTADGRVVKGREYLWGVAEGTLPTFPYRRNEAEITDVSAVENENHCDFRKLRSCLIRTHMLDLISTTEDTHYENYRQQQMETRKLGEPRVKKSDNPKFKEEEEGLRKRFTEQVKSEESRFRQWEQHVRSVFVTGLLVCLRLPLQLIAERDRLNKDLEMAHSAIKSLEAELDNLQVGYGRGSGRR